MIVGTLRRRIQSAVPVGKRPELRHVQGDTPRHRRPAVFGVVRAGTSQRSMAMILPLAPSRWEDVP